MAPVSAVAGGSSKTCQLWTYFGGRARGTCWQASSGCESRREGVFGPHNKKNKVAIHWNKESCKSSKFVVGGGSWELGLGYVKLGDSSVIQFRGAGLAVGSKGLESKGEACAPRLM